MTAARDDIHAISGAWVPDGLDDVEQAPCEAHLADRSACRREVGRRRAGASQPARESLRPQPPVADAPRSAAPPRRRVPPDSRASRRARQSRRRPGRWPAGFVVAAAIVTAGLMWHPWAPAPEQGPGQVAATQQVLQARDARRFEARAGVATATLVRSAGLNTAVIATSNLPAAPSGKLYELWLRQGNTMVEAGFLQGGGSDTVLLQGDVATAAAAAITTEPVGGSATPRLPTLALIALS